MANPSTFGQMHFYAQGMADALQKTVYIYQYGDGLQASDEYIKDQKPLAIIRPNSLPKEE